MAFTLLSFEMGELLFLRNIQGIYHLRLLYKLASLFLFFFKKGLSLLK